MLRKNNTIVDSGGREPRTARAPKPHFPYFLLALMPDMGIL